VKRTKLLAALAVGVLLMTSGCGVSDSIKSITLTTSGNSVGGTYNLAGVDGTLQLTVTANYNSGKTEVVTNASTWGVTTVGGDQSGFALPPFGPGNVTISPTGLMTTIEDVCTWQDAMNTTVTPNVRWNPPVWELTGYYQVTATYRNFTSQPVGIGVGSATSVTSPVGGCGPA